MAIRFNFLKYYFMAKELFFSGLLSEFFKSVVEISSLKFC